MSIHLSIYLSVHLFIHHLSIHSESHEDRIEFLQKKKKLRLKYVEPPPKPGSSIESK